MKTTRAILGVVALAAALSPTVHAAGARYRDVLALKPVGFWPANEGEGDRLRDLAATGNHAKVFNTPWAGDTLDFTGAFEFIEIPTYGYDAERRIREATLFAYSDDGGATFHRADGSSVKLPLTSNPAPEHNADTLKGYNEIWITQWVQLIRRIGFIF